MDGEMEDEIATSIAPLRAELDRLQEDALFSGEYDAGDALVTIQAGTGGTDAQDWAEILLRMYLRWAQNRGFQTELLEASPGEEAGLKSATFSVRGENAYGILKAERGVHRLVRQCPFDQAHRRHTSFAQVIVAPLLPDDADVDIDEGDLRIDTYRAQRRRRPAREQDRLGRPDHAPPDRDRRPVPERALARLEQADGDADPQVAAAGAGAGATRGGAGQGARRRADIGFGAGRSAATSCTPTSWSRTTAPSHETGNTQAVLDGALDEFVHEYLLAKAAGKVV